MRAIPTYYKGYCFRSKLEARWAVAFDAMGVTWLYEPEGYQLSDCMYLPDFLLTNVHCRSTVDTNMFVEVKGIMGDVDLHKIETFHAETGYPIIIVGSMDSPKPSESIWINNSFTLVDDTEPLWSYEYIDGDQYGCYLCQHEGQIWVAGANHDEYDGGRLMKKGLAAARSARFDHNHSGAQ